MPFDYKNSQLWFWDQDLQLTSKVYGIYNTVVGGTSFGTVGAAGSTSETFYLRGLRYVSGTGLPANGAGTQPNQISPGDSVFVTPTTALAGGLSVYGFISAANTLTVTVVNGSAAGIAAGSPNFVVTIIKFGQLDGLTS